MAKLSTTPHLRLVDIPERSAVSRDAHPPSRDPVQLPLLYVSNPRLLGFVDMSSMRAKPFIALLKELRPRWVMDLRTIPYFDLGGTTRRWFFDLFSELDIQYRDLSGRLDGAANRGPRQMSGNVAFVIDSLLARAPNSDCIGPVLILLDGHGDHEKYEQTLPGALRLKPKGGWDVCRIESGVFSRSLSDE